MSTSRESAQAAARVISMLAAREEEAYQTRIACEAFTRSVLGAFVAWLRARP